MSEMVTLNLPDIGIVSATTLGTIVVTGIVLQRLGWFVTRTVFDAFRVTEFDSLRALEDKINKNITEARNDVSIVGKALSDFQLTTVREFVQKADLDRQFLEMNRNLDARFAALTDLINRALDYKEGHHDR